MGARVARVRVHGKRGAALLLELAVPLDLGVGDGREPQPKEPGGVAREADPLGFGK